MRMRAWRCWFGLALLVPAVAPAATVAVWQLADGRALQVEYEDADTLRLNLGEDLALLVDGPREFLLQRQSGQWRATEVGQLRSQLQHWLGNVDMDTLRGQLPGGERLPQIDSQARLEATGRTETVAGMPGQVYRIHLTDARGQPVVHEAVLGDEPALLRLQQSLLRLASGLPGLQLPRALDALPETALLRYEQQMRLVRLEERALPASRFQPPQTTR